MQRKRHINFKDKGLNSSSSGRLSSILHSIPILLNMKNKSNVLYSIPCVKSCACTFCILLVLGLLSMVIGSDSCYATTSASLSLSTPNMQSSPVSQGSIATTSTDVKVEVSDAESYSLVLSVDSSSITNGSTTLVAGNVVSDNTWGYKWDNATTYSTPSTSGATLTNSTLVPLDSNGNISFTKNLTFGAKFSNNADAGHYKGSGTLSLVAEPKAISNPFGIETIQEMTPTICSNAEVGDLATLTDDRTYPSNVSKTYTIRKMEDGKCWMTQNLRLTGSSLTSSNSNVSSNYSLPTSNISSFNTTATTQAAYYDPGTDTGYYTWCAATANTCGNFTSNNSNSTYNICPKGWTLPTGGTSGNTDFYNLFKNMGLSISGSLSATSNTNWGTGDLAIAQGSPYNFAYTGYVHLGSLKITTTEGNWWSRTAYGSTGAYNLNINSSSVYPGTYNPNRYLGFAVRCVAEEPQSKFTLNYALDGSRNYYDSSKTTFESSYTTQTSPDGYSGNSYTFTTHATSLEMTWRPDSSSHCSQSIGGWTTNGSPATTYPLGGQVTLTEDSPTLTLYPTYTGWQSCS